MYISVKRDLVSQDIKSSVLLISACQDNQTAADTPTNGLFTKNLKLVWNGGAFDGSYRAFRDAINKSINSIVQVPNYFPVGAANGEFADSKPFSIGAREISGSIPKPSNAAPGARCHLEIVFERGFDGFGPEHGVHDFGDRVVPVMEATLQRIRDFNVMIGERGWEVGCKISDGHVSCGGSVSRANGVGTDVPIDGLPTMKLELATERLFAVDDSVYHTFLQDTIVPFARDLWEKWGVVTTRSRDMDDIARSWEGGCSVKSDGSWECHGGLSGRF